MSLQPLSNMTDDELIEHMTKHIKQMEEEYPDQYHTILADGMIYHIADMARRIRSRPAPNPEEANPWCYPGCILVDRAKKEAATCAWLLDEEYQMYETGCGNAFECIEGDIEENNFKFCPYCGGKIVGGTP